MVPSVVHLAMVIWMIVKCLDLMEIPPGVVVEAVVEEEALVIRVEVVDIMIAWVVEEVMVIHVKEEEEATVIRVEVVDTMIHEEVADTMIVWAVVKEEEDTTIIVILTLVVGEEVVKEEDLLLGLIAEEAAAVAVVVPVPMKVLHGDVVEVVVLEWAEWDQVALLQLHPVVIALV